MPDESFREPPETNRLLNNYIGGSNNIINSFMFDIDFGNFRIPYFQGFSFLIFACLETIFSIINPLIINDQIYETSYYKKVLNFRYFFGPSISFDPANIISCPSFYAMSVLVILMFFVYCILFYYNFTLCISKSMQFLIYLISSISYFIAWYTVVGFSASVTLAINTGHPYPIALACMSLFCIPAILCVIMKRYVDIRLKNSELAATNVTRTIEWLTLVLFNAAIQEINCYSEKYDTFKVFALIFQTIICLYNTILTIYSPNFTTLFIHCLSIMITSFSAINSFIGFVLYFFEHISFKVQLILYTVLPTVLTLFLDFISIYKWKSAKKLIENCESFHPSKYDTITLSYVICAVDPYKDQDKFPISLIYEIKEQFRDNAGLLIHFLSFKLFDKKCYPDIYNEANTMILTNSGNYINTIKLRSIIAASVGDIVFLNDINIFNRKKLNILLKPCYREITRFWRAAVKNDIVTIKDSIYNIASNVESYKHFFKMYKDFDDKFKRTVTCEFDKIEDNENVTEKMIEKCKRAEKYRVTDALVITNALIVFNVILLLISLTAPTWILCNSFTCLNSNNNIFAYLDIQESLMTVATALTERIFYEQIKMDPIYNFSKRDLIKFIQTKEKEYKGNKQLKNFIDTSLIDNFFFWAYKTALSTVNFKDIFDLSYSAGNMTICAKNISEYFGRVTEEQVNDILGINEKNYEDFKLTSIISCSIFVLIQIIVLILSYRREKIIMQACWQPMILEKNISIKMMNKFHKRSENIDVPASSSEVASPFGPIHIFILSLFVVPLSILIAYGYYLFLRIEIQSLAGSSYIGLSNTLLFSSLCTITASVSYKFKDDRINVIFENITSCLLDLANAFTSSNYDIELYKSYIHNNISDEIVDQYLFHFPSMSNTYDDMIFSLADKNILGNITDKLVKLAIRSQSMTAKYDTIPFQSMYSCVKIVLQTSDQIHPFNYEVKSIIRGINDFNKYMIVAIYIVFVIISVMVTFYNISIVTTIEEALQLIKRMVATAPGSPYFADDGFSEIQSKPESLLPYIIDTMPNGIIFFNTSNIITFANTEAIYMYGDIVGEDISVLTTDIVDSNGIQRRIELKTFDSSLISFGYFDKEFKDNFIVATDTTNLKSIETKVELLKNEIWQNFTLPAEMEKNQILLMENPVMLDIVIDESVPQYAFDSMTAAIKEEIFNYQCVFHTDLQRYALYIVFYSIEESLRRIQAKEAINFGIAILHIMKKFNVLGKVGIANLPHLTAIVEKTVAPKIVLIGEDLWKAVFLTKFAENGEIAAERSISKRIATQNVTFVRSRTAHYGNENIDYVIINDEEST